MKRNVKHIFLFFPAMVFFIISFAQNKDEQMKLIRKKFAIINKDTTLRKVVLENEEFLINMPDGGGKLTGFYKGREIKKISEWIGLSNGISIKEFYFDNDQLFFVYEKFDSFEFDDKKNEIDHSKTKTIFEGRYYFNNKKIFNKSAKGDKTLAAQGETTEESLLEGANENREKLDKKVN